MTLHFAPSGINPYLLINLRCPIPKPMAAKRTLASELDATLYLNSFYKNNFFDNPFVRISNHKVDPLKALFTSKGNMVSLRLRDIKSKILDILQVPISGHMTFNSNIIILFKWLHTFSCRNHYVLINNKQIL